MVNNIFETIGYYFYEYFVRLICEPFVLLKVYFMPGGSIFVAYDYDTEYAELNGRRLVKYKDDPSAHLFGSNEKISLPIQNKSTQGSNIIYTAYTNKNFLIDTEHKILYLKYSDAAFFGELCWASFFSERSNQKKHIQYLVEAQIYLNKQI